MSYEKGLIERKATNRPINLTQKKRPCWLIFFIDYNSQDGKRNISFYPIEFCCYGVINATRIY